MKGLKAKWWLILGALLLVLCAVLYLLLSPSAFPDDPNLVRTSGRVKITKVAAVGSGFTGLVNGVLWKYHQLKLRLRPDPFAWSFAPVLTARPCSIQESLNRCAEVSGTEYLIEKNVAGASVIFGHTNVLNGQQWVQAFEQSLQKNDIILFDKPNNQERDGENLVLLRYNKRTVLVLTPATAVKYREKYPKLVPLER